MGAFPRVTKQTVRVMHLRGINRCIMTLGMTDYQEIATASGLNSAQQVEDNLTQAQKMKLGKSKKAKSKKDKPELADD